MDAQVKNFKYTISASRAERYGIDSLEVIPISDLAVDHEGYLWIGSHLGLWKTSSFDKKPIKVDSQSVSIITLTEKYVFYTNESALCYKKLSSASSNFTSYDLRGVTVNKRYPEKNKNNSEGISKDVKITCMSFYKGSLWVGTENDGLFCFSFLQGIFTASNKHFLTATRPKKKDGLLSTNVTTLYIDDKDNLWVGTDKGICIFQEKLETNGEKTISWKYLLKDHRITAINGKEEQIYIAGKGERNRNFVKVLYSPLNEDQEELKIKNIPINEYFQESLIYDLEIDKVSNLWISSGIVGLYRGLADLKKDEWPSASDTIWTPIIYDKEKGLITKQPEKLQTGPEGRIWVGSKLQGLFILRKSPDVVIQDEEIVRCHDDNNAKFTIRVINGQPPFTFTWHSKKNKKTEIIDDEKMVLNHLSADTIYIKVEDVFKQDSTVIEYYIENPEPISGELIKDSYPSFSDKIGGVLRIANLAGGRVRKQPISKHSSIDYLFIWEHAQDTLKRPRRSRLTTGIYKVTIQDTVGCQHILKDTFPKIDNFKKLFKYMKTETEGAFQFHLFFKADSSSLREEYASELDVFAKFMINEDTSIKFEIGGHTKTDKKDAIININSEWAQNLSEQRANAVRNYLIKAGVSPHRLKAKGYGKRVPLYPDTPERNQRVELKVIRE